MVPWTNARARRDATSSARAGPPPRAPSSAGWPALRSGAGIHIERADDALSARRSWVCALPQGEARIPCGGTHLTGLDEVDTIRVALDAGPVDGGLELRMRTTVALRP